jgi:hypothetical protein
MMGPHECLLCPQVLPRRYRGEETCHRIQERILPTMQVLMKFYNTNNLPPHVSKSIKVKMLKARRG